MDSSSLDLTLTLGPSYVSNTISTLLKELSNADNFSDRLWLLNDYLHRHQEELSRFMVFEHELPQRMLLLLDAIETLKEQVMCTKNDMESESNEQRLTQYLLTKRTNYEMLQKKITGKYSTQQENIYASSCSQFYLFNHGGNNDRAIVNTTKMQPCNRDGQHTMRSLKGWNTTWDSSSMTATKQLSENFVKGSSLIALNVKPVNFQSVAFSKHLQKNIRRSWSPELHARFLEAVEYLGGPEVATPKPIREIMKVEGLTNDQVKSHLQKYRLHLRRALEDSAKHLGWTDNFQDPWTSSDYYYCSPGLTTSLDTFNGHWE